MASSVMDRPEEGRMHLLAVRAAPDIVVGLTEHLAKPKARMVAVERHNCDWREGSKRIEERFLWIKARDKITVEQVRTSYRSHYSDVCAEIPLTLSVDSQVPEDSTALGNLNFHNDQYIVFSTQTPSITALVASLNSPPFGPNMGTSQNAVPQLPQETDSLMDLPPTMGEQAIFMQQDAEYDTPDLIEHDDADSLMAYFQTREQSLQPAPGVRSIVPIRRSSPLGSQRGSQVSNRSPKIPARAINPYLLSGEYIPRRVRSVFGGSDLPETENKPKPSQPSLQRLLQERSPEQLEVAVKRGLAVLTEIEEPLHDISRHGDAQKWLEQIETVREMAKRKRTVIGVVGNTGAGKSSVINAILDEERLVPTNCMRACTAVVTEFSYNESNVESARYRAEIEFIQPDDWRRELKVLFDEVFDSLGGMSKEVSNPDSVAGVAYAKIRAVYHKYTKEMLQRSSIDQLMNLPSMQLILGTVKRINSRDGASFYQRLQHYVDSQQKPTATRGPQPKRELELWPLIKVVRIYTKADALSTGAVIVDLPGVHDSNAARAAVAEGYMKECTGLWIVAPITRAVDDKAAKTLLGNTFKRQLKYDGSYSAVTFICSKTDDISRTEAADTLQLGDVLAEQDAERDIIDQQICAVKDKWRQAQADREKQNDKIERHEDEQVYWEEELSKIEDDDTSDASVSPTKKRKRAFEHEDSEESDDRTITPQDIRNEIEKYKRLKKSAREHARKLRDDIQALQLELYSLENRKTKIDKDAEALCIQGRNEWSRARIRADFAEGIKELDQENAAEENPEEFDPDEDIRDYEEVARSLPVFCVSSRAYQKLSGRLGKDGDVNGFNTLTQTEIPGLQAHSRKLTEGGRHDGCKSFLNSLSRLLTSLTLWASDDGSNPESSVQQRQMLKVFIASNLEKLRQALKEAVDQIMTDVEDTLTAQLRHKFASAARNAANKALHTSDGWGAPRNEGGLFWATYKATVRRQGVFQGASGSRNFNKDLTEPLTMGLSGQWDKTFKHRLPAIFNSFPKMANTYMRYFHNAVEDECTRYKIGMSRIARLRDNIIVLEGAFDDLAKTTINNVNEAQREINREFAPSVATAMAAAYERCSREIGKGSFDRMKKIMHDEVSANEVTMFTKTTVGIWNQLDVMCKQCRVTLQGRVGRMYQTIARDYQTIVGNEIGKERATSKPERAARRKVDDLMAQSEAVFAEVLDYELEGLKDVEVTEDHGRVVGDETEVDVEDATQPLIVLSSDGVEDEDDLHS